MSNNWPPDDFPNLQPTDYEITSPESESYNCVAWAASDTEKWWWPDDPDIGYGYWPPGVPREETVEAFIEAYQTVGYAPCEDFRFEDGFEKIALYALSGTPTHAARQLRNGSWTSKLGTFEDIEPDNATAPVE